MRLYNISEGDCYLFHLSGWNSFCGGKIISLTKVKRPGPRPRNLPAATKDHVQVAEDTAYCECSSYESMLAKICDTITYSSYILTDKTTADRVLSIPSEVQEEYYVHEYTADKEQYVLFIQKSATQYVTLEGMAKTNAKPPKKSAFDDLVRRMRSRVKPEVQDIVQKIVDNTTVQDDMSLVVNKAARVNRTKPKVGYTTYVREKNPNDGGAFFRPMRWGMVDDNTEGLYDPTPSLLSGITVDGVRIAVCNRAEEPATPITLSTYMYPASISVGYKYEADNWVGWDYANVHLAPLIFGKEYHSVYFQAAFETLATGMRVQSRIKTYPNLVSVGENRSKPVANIKLPRTNTIWLVDNLGKNMSCAGSRTCTGTIINMMLHENLKGNFSMKLSSGETMYFRVCSKMAGNPNKTSRGIFVAAVSFSPIKEKIITEKELDLKVA